MLRTINIFFRAPCIAPEGLHLDGTCGLCIVPEGLCSDGTCGFCDPFIPFFPDGKCLECVGPEGFLPGGTCGPMEFEWIGHGGCATDNENYPPEISSNRVKYDVCYFALYGSSFKIYLNNTFPDIKVILYLYKL